MGENSIKCLIVIYSEASEDGDWFGGEFEATTEFCPLIGSDLQVFDANGDGYDDLTCHSSNGTITISESHIVEQVEQEEFFNKHDDIQGGESLTHFNQSLCLHV